MIDIVLKVGFKLSRKDNIRQGEFKSRVYQKFLRKRMTVTYELTGIFLKF